MKGVTKIPEQYKARVRFLGRTTHIGCFPTEEIALKIVADIQEAIDSFEEEAKKMLPGMLEKAIQKHTPRRRAEPTPEPAPKPSRRRAEPTPEQSKTMPERLYGVDRIHHDAEPETYMLHHAHVRAKVPLFDYDPATGVAEDPKTKTLHDTKQFESHMNAEYDADHIYWADPKTDKFVFKTVND